jgi:hypothetical protein
LIDSAAGELAPARIGNATNGKCDKYLKVPTTLEATAAGHEIIEHRRFLLSQIGHNIPLHNEYAPRHFEGNTLTITCLSNKEEA